MAINIVVPKEAQNEDLIRKARLMRSHKRFSNTSFTKRVDHEAGRHRTKRAGKEPAVCISCGALYSHRRWTAAEADRGTTEPEHRHPAKRVLCPACKQKSSADASGFVTVEGNFFVAHREDIDHLVRNEAARAAEDNPLARIMRWRETKRKLRLATTTEHLAQRLGHALEKAFDGTVNYDFSHENKVARVNWRRD